MNFETRKDYDALIELYRESKRRLYYFSHHTDLVESAIRAMEQSLEGPAGHISRKEMDRALTFLIRAEKDGES